MNLEKDAAEIGGSMRARLTFDNGGIIVQDFDTCDKSAVVEHYFSRRFYYAGKGWCFCCKIEFFEAGRWSVWEEL